MQVMSFYRLVNKSKVYSKFKKHLKGPKKRIETITLLITLLVKKISPPTFAVIWFSRLKREIKREVRCKTGAIPVAVNDALIRRRRTLGNFSNYKPLFQIEAGRELRESQARRPAISNKQDSAFG